MGCCGTKSELSLKLINNVFDDLKIRKDTIPEFHEYYRMTIENKQFTPIYNKNTINENEFQILVNEKLLNNYEDNIMNDFWFSFYNGIQFSDRLLYIKFILSFFCKPSKNEEEIICMRDLLIKIKNYRHSDLKEEFNEKFFDKEELIDILSFYIELITTQSIEHFKFMFKDSDKFEKEKKEEWNPDYIRNFIFYKYFNDLEIDPSHRHSIIIDNFLNENLDKLRNYEKIREDFAKFCIEYEKYLLNKDLQKE